MSVVVAGYLAGSNETHWNAMMWPYSNISVPSRPSMRAETLSDTAFSERVHFTDAGRKSIGRNAVTPSNRKCVCIVDTTAASVSCGIGAGARTSATRAFGHEKRPSLRSPLGRDLRRRSPALNRSSHARRAKSYS